MSKPTPTMEITLTSGATVATPIRFADPCPANHLTLIGKYSAKNGGLVYISPDGALYFSPNSCIVHTVDIEIAKVSGIPEGTRLQQIVENPIDLSETHLYGLVDGQWITQIVQEETAVDSTVQDQAESF